MSSPPSSPSCVAKIVSQSTPDDSANAENESGVLALGTHTHGSEGIGCDVGVDGITIPPSDVDINQTNLCDMRGSKSENGTGNSSFDDSVHTSDVDMIETNGLQTQGSTHSMIEEGWFQSALEEESGVRSVSSQTSNDSANNQESSSSKSAPYVERGTSIPNVASSVEQVSDSDINNAAVVLSKHGATDSSGENDHSKIDHSINDDVESDASFDRYIFQSPNVGVTTDKETRPTKSFASTISDKEDRISSIPPKGITVLKDFKVKSKNIQVESSGESSSNAANSATLNEIVDLCSSDSDDDDRNKARAPVAATASAKVSSDDAGSGSLSCSNSSSNGSDFLYIGQEVSVSMGKRDHDATIVSLKDGWAEVQWSWGKATELVPISSIQKFMFDYTDGYSKRSRKMPELFAFSSSLKTEDTTKTPAKKKARRAKSTGYKHVGGQKQPIVSSTTKMNSMSALNAADIPSVRNQTVGTKRKESSDHYSFSIEEKEKKISLEKFSAVAPSSCNRREKNASEEYYSVVGILDRRETPYDKGSKCYVEYLVQWANSPSGEEYEPTWQPAEDLDRKCIEIF
eukprot:CCRYP_014052-RA/>CCRYP_014052-RA protein AED:0.02 eAED:0.02 QI:54/1/0.75/1/1/0.75/4/1989/572